MSAPPLAMIVSEIYSCLISSNAILSANEIEAEYYKQEKVHINPQQYGFENLEQLLLQYPEQFILMNLNSVNAFRAAESSQKSTKDLQRALREQPGPRQRYTNPTRTINKPTLFGAAFSRETQEVLEEGLSSFSVPTNMKKLHELPQYDEIHEITTSSSLSQSEDTNNEDNASQKAVIEVRENIKYKEQIIAAQKAMADNQKLMEYLKKKEAARIVAPVRSPNYSRDELVLLNNNCSNAEVENRLRENSLHSSAVPRKLAIASVSRRYPKQLDMVKNGRLVTLSPLETVVLKTLRCRPDFGKFLAGFLALSGVDEEYNQTLTLCEKISAM